MTWVFEFTREDGQIYIRDSDSMPSIPELAALLAGIKPIYFMRAPKRDKNNLLKFTEFFRLKFRCLGAPDWDKEKELLNIFVAKTQKSLDKACEAAFKTFEQRALGNLLGYPACCSRAYLRSLEKGVENPLSSFDHSRPSAFHFLLNNLFLLQSRPGQRKFKSRLYEINRGENISIGASSVIWWHPCSYQCAPSIKIVKAV